MRIAHSYPVETGFFSRSLTEIVSPRRSSDNLMIVSRSRRRIPLFPGSELVISTRYLVDSTVTAMSPKADLTISVFNCPFFCATTLVC